MEREETITRLVARLEELRNRYHVAHLSVFGSVARDQAGPGSDIDLLVEFSKTPGLFEFIDLKLYLEALLEAPVDLVTRRALKPQLREGILSGAIHVC